MISMDEWGLQMFDFDHTSDATLVTFWLLSWAIALIIGILIGAMLVLIAQGDPMPVNPVLTLVCEGLR